MTFMGMLSCYCEHSVPRAEMKADNSEGLVEKFERFIEDETCKAISVQARRLGFPAEIERAKNRMRYHVKRLTTKAPFKQLVDFSTKVVTAATSVPVADTALAEAMLRKRYLPPIINFDAEVVKALERWDKLKPDFRAFDNELAQKLKEGRYTEADWAEGT